jgi:low molecular weight protein-tyrosine phosphatase
MAGVVLEHKLAEAGLSSDVVVDTAGTGTWHLGEQMDERAAATLVAAGYDPSRHRARLFESDWFASHDVILVMDESNYDDVLRSAASDADRDRVLMFRAFDPAADGDLVVPDPWYGGKQGFDDVHQMVERTSDSLVAALAARWGSTT